MPFGLAMTICDVKILNVSVFVMFFSRCGACKKRERQRTSFSMS